MRPLQAAFLRAGAVKRAWRIYCRENFGAAAARRNNDLLSEILADIVQCMSDSAIRRMALTLIQADDLTDRERAQLAAIIKRRT